MQSTQTARRRAAAAAGGVLVAVLVSAATLVPQLAASPQASTLTVAAPNSQYSMIVPTVPILGLEPAAAIVAQEHPQATGSPAPSATPDSGPATAQSADVATLVARVTAAVRAAKNVSVTATLKGDGAPVQVYALGTLDGREVKINATQGDRFVKVVTLGSASYVRGNAAYWRAGLGRPARWGQDWVSASAAEATELSAGRTPKVLADAVLAALSSGERLDLLPDVNGKRVLIVFTRGTGSDKQTFVVPTDTWLPERVQTASGTYVFSNWNSTEQIERPKKVVAR